MEDIKVIREKFREYLYKLVADNKLSKVDADTQYSDADYPRKHADELGINYWEAFRDDASLENLLSILKERFEKEGKNPSTIVSYKRALKSFRNFIEEQYAGVKNMRNGSQKKYYWVCQGQQKEDKKYILAPVDNFHHHKRVNELKVGDVVISYFNQQVNAISTVIKNPEIIKNGNDDWYKAVLDYKELDKPIPKSVIKNIMKNNNIKSFIYGPFDVNYDYNQGYLFNFSKELLDLILENDQGVKIMKSSRKEEKQPLNQILYGPPGTGKTYNTIVEAMKVLDTKLFLEYKNLEASEKQDFYNNRLIPEFNRIKNEEKRIEFVTFHQSYSYEEFVEGIKPNLNDEKLGYVLENGIFKNICDHAKSIVTTSIKREPIDFSNTKVFKMSLGNTLEKEDDIYDYCIENNVVSLGWKDLDFSNCKTRQDFKNLDDSWGATALERFVKWMDIGDIIIISNGNRNFRAIAQVKSDYIYDKNTPISHTHFRKVEWLYKGEDIHYSKINDKIFSQQSIYGYFSPSKKGQLDYNPDLKTDELNKIITGEINKEVSKPHVLIIDEINRGDVSKIFGELITLIEEDKRIGNKYQMKITLPYSKEPFGVPNNLYIIGTMNTADRSIALLDTALRRRFDFEEIMPRPELLSGKVIEGINLQTLLTRINERITNKYDRDHQIGHSYLMGVDNKEQLERAFKNRILPLLNEYFYNESKTVSEILNCSEDELQTSDFISILGKAQGE